MSHPSLHRLLAGLFCFALLLSGCPDDDDDSLPDDDDVTADDDDATVDDDDATGDDDDATGDDDDATGDDDDSVVDADGDGFDGSEDCDDTDDTVFPGAPELCDNQDNDCDGLLGAEELDDDGDGVSECDGDCDDGEAHSYPGNPEVCDDGVDNDCDAGTDEAVDGDGDGSTLCDGDCDDDDGATFPGATEICNGQDDDCDAATTFEATLLETAVGSAVEPGANRWRGNAYRLDVTTTLSSFEQRLETGAGETLTWLVFESNSPMGGYTLLTSTTTTVAAPEADAMTWHSSGDLDVALLAGRFYAMVVHWTEDLEYEREPAPNGITPTPFGALLSAVAGDGDTPPLGEEVEEADSTAWYPQRVIASAEDDFDGDGALACDDDCNDGEGSAFVGATEINCDLVDNDCDSATPDCNGGVVVTEIFSDAFGSDSDQEWFEIENLSASDLDLDGWLIRDDASDGLYVDGSYVLLSGAIAVLGETADTALNGGVLVDLEYGGELSLGNSEDELILVSPVGEITDGVAWSDAGGFPSQPGSAMSLDIAATNSTDNDNGSSWCVSYAGTYGPGLAVGSPGAPNPSCTVPPSGAVAGDLIVTEILNTSASPIDLLGFEISDNGTDVWTVTLNAPVPAGGYFVLGQSTDVALNGGAPVDLPYVDALTLGNADDELIITSPDGTEIDRVEWDDGATFPDPEGATMNLVPGGDGTSNDLGSNWCTSTAPTYGTNGDLGTPGAENVACD